MIMFHNREPVVWEEIDYPNKLVLNNKWWALRSHWKKKGYKIVLTFQEFVSLLEYHDILDVKIGPLGSKFRVVPIDTNKPITRENVEIKTKLKGYGRNFN